MPRVDISIRRKHSSRSTGDQHKGAINPQPQAEYFPRRNSGFINFYDLGQIWNGSAFVDIDFKKLDDPGNLSVALGSGGHCSADFDASAGTQTYHDLLRAKIFEIDEADWKTKYYKFTFEDAEKYGVELRDAHLSDSPTNVYPLARNGSRNDFAGNPITDTKWTAKGLKVPSDLASFCVQPFGSVWYFDNSDKFKITKTPDYSATAVTDFALSKKADIFLVPNIVNLFFQTESHPDPFTFLENALFAAYAPLSRAFWLSFSFSGAANGLFNEKPAAFSLASGQKTALISHAMTDRPPTRDFSTVSTSGSTTFSENPSGTFPLYSGGWLAEVGNDFASDFSSRGTALNNHEGRLVGVIKQAGGTYYFWTGGSAGVLTQSDFGRWSFG